MKMFSNITPIHLGISKKFWLFNSGPEFDGTYPYQNAISTLQKISDVYTVGDKIKILTNTQNTIVDCINQFYGYTKTNSNIILGKLNLFLSLFFFLKVYKYFFFCQELMIFFLF